MLSCRRIERVGHRAGAVLASQLLRRESAASGLLRRESPVYSPNTFDLLVGWSSNLRCHGELRMHPSRPGGAHAWLYRIQPARR